MTNFAEKIRPRIIVFDLTIHRENVYQDEAYTKPFVPAIIIVKNNVECNTNHIFRALFVTPVYRYNINLI
jgi:hypothetical protein